VIGNENVTSLTQIPPAQDLTIFVEKDEIYKNIDNIKNILINSTLAPNILTLEECNNNTVISAQLGLQDLGPMNYDDPQKHTLLYRERFPENTASYAVAIGYLARSDNSGVSIGAESKNEGLSNTVVGLTAQVLNLATKYGIAIDF
jgi:hypothetical protein